MFAFFMGIENGQWKWQCLACKKIFHGKPGDANVALESHNAAEHRVEPTLDSAGKSPAVTLLNEIYMSE